MESVSLVNEIGYDSAFTFIYSPRAGTAAAEFKDQVPAEVSTRRIQTLIQAVEQGTLKVHRSLVGVTEEVLVEGVSKRSKTMVSGKGRRNITVTFAGDQRDTGKLIQVKITSAAANTLRGEKENFE